jgi:hypothetical protein
VAIEAGGHTFTARELPSFPDAGRSAGSAAGATVDTTPAEFGCAARYRCVIVPAIVIHRQEVRPMNAVSAVGAPLPSTIARLR